jgi:hypothetical protein
MTDSNESAHHGATRSRLAGRVLIVALLAGAALGACSRDQPTGPEGARAVPDGPSFTLNPACDPGLGGVIHSDTVHTAVTWARADNPHFVYSALSVTGAGHLTLEPGVIVCAGPVGYLSVSYGGTLTAIGLDTARIVFTAIDSAQRWSGMGFSAGPATTHSLKNVTIEHIHPSQGITSFDLNAVVIDSAVIRQAGSGVYLMGRGSGISRSRVDTAGSATSAAVTLGTMGRFEETTIRGARGTGLQVIGANGVSLLGGRIEGSGGVGLKVTTPGYGIVAGRPIRVVGGASYPAEMVVSAPPRIYTAGVHHDSLKGNARDTLVITGGSLGWLGFATKTLPWRVTGQIDVTYMGLLHLLPGASLTFDGGAGIYAYGGGRVVARGTPADRVLFTGNQWGGIALASPPASWTYLTNVVIEKTSGVAVTAFSGHPVVIDSAVFRQNGAAVELMSQGSRISRSRVDTTHLAQGAVVLGANSILESTLIRASAGDGVSVASAGVQILSCDIRGSAGNGIDLGVAVSVHDCNLVGNGGPGIRNLDPATANVEDVWWGDAAGPAGPSGDGVSGLLDYTPWRTTPFVLPYVP